MDIRVPVEDFALRIRERLVAVSQDREAMTQKARDLARQRGLNYEDIMDAEWYELPEACKYLTSSSPGPEPCRESNGDTTTPPSPRLTISPSELTPRSTLPHRNMNGLMLSSSEKEMNMVDDAFSRNLQVSQVSCVWWCVHVM